MYGSKLNFTRLARGLCLSKSVCIVIAVLLEVLGYEVPNDSMYLSFGSGSAGRCPFSERILLESGTCQRPI